MKNVTKAVAAAATALCLLAAPSDAMAGAGVWDPKGDWKIYSGVLSYYQFNSGGGDVMFCVSQSGTYGFTVKSVNGNEFSANTQATIKGNCAVFTGIGSAGSYSLWHRYSGQPALSGVWYD